MYLLGEVDNARTHFDLAEPLLRDVGDRLELAKLLAKRVLLDVEQQRRDDALSAFTEVQTIAIELGIGPDADLTKSLTELRQTLDI